MARWGGGTTAWRLEEARFAPTWDSGEGAFLYGGRWNSTGTRVVYASFDAATAILEVAVHKTFRILDTIPHAITAFEILEPSAIHVIEPEDLPNPNWLRTGVPSAGQQVFGDSLLSQHIFIAIPSSVSPYSWNVFFDPVRAKGAYKAVMQERFALDTRLHPARAP